MDEFKVLSEEDMQALAEGGFADIVGKIDERLYALEQITGDNWVTGALAANDAAAGVFSWHNTLGHDVVVTKAIVQVKVVASAACTIDVGEAATAISANTLLTGLDVRSATGVFDNITNKGASGETSILVPDGAFVTASKASGATAGLVGRFALQIVNAG